MAGESWISRVEPVVLFGNRGKGAEAARMLEVSEANKTIVDKEQAILLQDARVIESMYLGIYPDSKTDYTWVSQLIDNLEVTQQTMAGETNSRLQFIKVAVAQFGGVVQSAKNTIGEAMNK